MKNNIRFTGGDTQTGTTMISLAVAEMLAKEGERILFISGGAFAGNDFFPRIISSGTDEVLSALLAENLSAEQLQQAVVRSRGIDILMGVRRGRTGRYFNREDLRDIYSVAVSVWDRIVMDGGCVLLGNREEEAALPGWVEYMVVTQQEKTIQRYVNWSMEGNSGGERNSRFVLNKYNDSGAFYTIKEISSLLKCAEKDILPVPYVPYGWQAEAEHTTLLNFRRFRKAIGYLIEDIQKGDRNGNTDGTAV